ncbi:HEAT repeat domain-containing protein [bacterium]|nr:HEAT repeat domain-containing protein [bacterium]
MRTPGRPIASVLTTLLLLVPLSHAATPLERPDDREVPPDRGRLFIKDPMIFRGLLVDLQTQSRGPAKRINAIGIFALTREQIAVRPLVSIAMNANEHIDVRVAALWALGEIGYPRSAKPAAKLEYPAALPALQLALYEILADAPNKNPWRKSKGLTAEVGGKTVTISVKDMVMDQLARLGEPVAPKLAEFLARPIKENITTEPNATTPDVGRMRAALVTLVAVGDRSSVAVRALCDVLRANDAYYPPDFKVIAAQGLASLAANRKKVLADVEARDPLAEYIARAFVEACVISQVHQIREIAGTALRDMGKADTAVREVLIILNAPTIPKEVRYRAIETLAFVHTPDKITASQAADALIVQLHHADRNVRWRAAVSLGAVGDSRAVAYLRRLVQDEKPLVRIKVIAALGHLESKDALPDVVKALTDTDHRVRRQAALALGRLGAESSVPDLVRLGLKDKHPSVRSSSIIALGYIGGVTAIRSVAGMLNDPDQGVRFAAVQVLARFRNPGATKSLARAIADPDKDVSAAGALALRERLQASPARTIPLLVKFAREDAGTARLGAVSSLAADWRALDRRNDPGRATIYDELLAPPDGALLKALLAVLSSKEPRAARRDAALLLVECGWKHKSRAPLEAVAGLEDDLDIQVRTAAKRAQNYLRNLPKR